VRTLWGALLTVPGYVLTDNKTKYGNYGQVDRARCIRCKTHIFHIYVPDLLLKMGGGACVFKLKLLSLSGRVIADVC